MMSILLPLERYQPLPYAVCQLMFVSMKKELLEDYRIRLVQLRKEFSPSSKQYSAILNTAHYLLKVLNEWKEQPVSGVHVHMCVLCIVKTSHLEYYH